MKNGNLFPGATREDAGVLFGVRSGTATRVWVSLFDDAGERETERVELAREDETLFSGHVSGLKAGARYGFRADGRYDPSSGFWFDPDKLLTDPFAKAIDRPYHYDARLGSRRGEGADTAALMPKAIVVDDLPALPLAPPRFPPGGLIYELAVRSFSMRNPEVPAEKRGTIAALAEPAVIAHLRRLGVSAVELLPIVAWMDERHLPPLGLSNAWGYNPVSFMALDPRLAPGGMAELRDTVAALHREGIGTILDVVFNHTAESDAQGTTLSLRGLDARAYFRHAADGTLINDTGTGNTLACDHPQVHELVLASLRHFVEQAGVDGFRFDLATVLGRTATGFDADGGLLHALRADPVIGGRVLIAEPWDIGPGGYRLGQFGAPFGEWNDRFRDDVRRFWRGDRGMIGTLATRLAGSFDCFTDGPVTRSVNFLAAHDGMTLFDCTAYSQKHNEANGEANRDGHSENHSWNNGVEGPSSDPAVRDARAQDARAMLATLFASRGAIMLAAGDEWGRSQHGNNNAYAQDNEAFWLDWEARDHGLEAYVAELAVLRGAFPVLGRTARLTGAQGADGLPDVGWMKEDGGALEPADWDNPERRCLAMLLSLGAEGGRLAVCVNGERGSVTFKLPARDGWSWRLLVEEDTLLGEAPSVQGRSVGFFLEERDT